MTGAVSICHYGFENACISKLPHMERNSRCSSFVRMRNPTPLFSLGLWRRKATMATLEQKAFCVLQFAKNESFVSVQRAFRRQFNSDPPSPSSIRRWYQQFQTTGCFCKGKSAGRPRVSEEGVERVRQSFFKLLWLLPLGLREGQSVCSTTTREHTWFGEQNYRCYGEHHIWLADQSMAGNGLSPRCVPCDEWCTHRTFVVMYHKL